MKGVLFLLMFGMTGLLSLSAQEDKRSSCAIIDIDKATGTVMIRNNQNGIINTFKPDALELAELNVGDSIQAFDSTATITDDNGISRQYALQTPHYSASCCSIMSIEVAKDDKCCGVAIVKHDSTGEHFRFSLFNGTDFLLKVNTPVFTRESVGYAMVAVPSQSDTTNKIVYGFPILPKQVTGEPE